MAPGHIVVVGASAGGVAALEQFASELPADSPAAIFVVLHVLPYSESLLPQILSRSGKLRATHPQDGEAFVASHIYVAPPDYHMTVQDGAIRLDRGPAENRHRPSIDVLFRSAARSFDGGTIAVLLTGSDDDGAAGMLEIRRAGGVTIVQDPAESLFPAMPQSALNYGAVDHTLQLASIAEYVQRLTANGMPGRNKSSWGDGKHSAGSTGAYSCPECGGGMVEVRNGDLLQFRCRVGHMLSPESMMQAEKDAVDHALWAAVRALEDNAALLRRIASEALTGTGLRPEYEARAEEQDRHAAVIREILKKP